MVSLRTKARRERVGRKKNPFEGSKLLGVDRDSTFTGGASEVNPISHMVMDPGPVVANRMHSLCVQTCLMTGPSISQ